jgi:hypothetical protein
MVSYTRTTGESWNNSCYYDSNTCDLWRYIVFNKKKVRKSGFKPDSILSVGPKKIQVRRLGFFSAAKAMAYHQSVGTVYHHASRVSKLSQ